MVSQLSLLPFSQASTRRKALPTVTYAKSPLNYKVSGSSWYMTESDVLDRKKLTRSNVQSSVSLGVYETE